MPRFSSSQVYANMEDAGILPVFHRAEAEVAIRVVEALAAGGATVVEMTAREDFAIEVFKAVELHCRRELPQVALGVGTILDAPTAALFIAYGASFVVSPVLEPEIISLCNRRSVGVLPGCSTLGEIQAARKFGAEYCKLFPAAAAGGAGFVREVRAPCPWVRLVPMGGLAPTRESLEPWFSAGIACAGMGSKLIPPEAVAQGRYSLITENTRRALSLAQELRR